MARATEPKLMLLDEPASGLSRGERVALTDLLLELEKSITLILIEHDMDVALRVAQSEAAAQVGVAPETISPAKLYPKVVTATFLYLHEQQWERQWRQRHPRRAHHQARRSRSRYSLRA